MKDVTVDTESTLHSTKKNSNEKPKTTSRFTTLADDIDFIISDLLSIVLKDPSIKLKQSA